MLLSTAFQFFGTAEYIEEQVTDIYKLREQAEQPASARPLIIWEPHAKSCQPKTLRAHQEAAEFADVFSPNHEELAGFFDERTSTAFDPQVIERQAKSFLDVGVGPSGDGCMLVRAAGHGCLVMSRGTPPTWLPSFYASDSDMVVDPTGAGNAFLGAFAIGWQETQSYVEAAKHGQIAASFTIEQAGLPARFAHGDAELWNRCSVRERLAAYQARFAR